MRLFRPTLAACLVLLTGVLGLSAPAARAQPKMYWHFTLQSVSDEDQAEEWLWVTMVERTKEETFPETAEAVKGMGGVFPGTVLGHVRGAAWRANLRYTKSRKCKSRASKLEVSSNSSWSDEVFAHGSVISASTWKGEPVHFRFKFGLADDHSPVLMEDGQRRNLSDLVHAFVGPIHVPGEEREELLGPVNAHGINYEDMLVHYKHCGRSWAEQLQTPLTHYESYNLEGAFVGSPDWESGGESFQFHGFTMTATFKIVRSHSPEHPFWKQKRMN